MRDKRHRRSHWAALADEGVGELIDELHQAMHPPRISPLHLELSAQRSDRAKMRADRRWTAYQELRHLDRLLINLTSPKIGDRPPGRCRRLGWSQGLYGEDILVDLDTGVRIHA